MASKKRILFVVDTLAQHGAERYLFEILKALNKDKFKCTVLSTYPLNGDNSYYRPLIEGLGIEVKQFNYGDLYGNTNNKFIRKLKNTLTYRYYNLAQQNKKLRNLIQNELTKELKGYDLISILKIEVFNRFPEVFVEFDNIIIHLLSWGIQYSNNPYIDIPDSDYNFLTIHKPQKEHVLNTKFNKLNLKKRNVDFYHFPLPIDLSEKVTVYKVPENPVIAVFSRINYDQPTIMFLFALQIIKKKIPEIKLYFYGKYLHDEFINFYIQTLRVLGLEESVIFKGHINNIKQAIFNDQISMAWMNIGGNTLGYSSIEIACHGLPISFFNIEPNSEYLQDSRIQSFNCLNEFANNTVALLKNEDLLIDNNNKLIDFLNENHDVNVLVKKLENYYLKFNS